MANKTNSTRVCDSTIAQVFLLAIASRIEQDIHPQRGWSHTNRYYKTVNSEYTLLIPQLVDDKNHGFCAKHHTLLLNLVLDTHCNCTIRCIPEFKRWPMQSVIAFLSLSWKTLVWTVLPPLASSSSMMIVNGDGTIITMLWHSFQEICYLQLRGGTRRRERERKRQPLLSSCFFSSHNLLMCEKLDEVMCFFGMWSQEFSLICKFKILKLEGRSTCATHQREMVFRISWCGFQQWARVAIIIMGGDV